MYKSVEEAGRRIEETVEGFGEAGFVKGRRRVRFAGQPNRTDSNEGALNARQVENSKALW